MEPSQMATTEHGELTTTGGATYDFHGLVIPQTHKRYPQFYGVPSGEDGVSVRIEVAWDHLASVSLTKPDDLYGLPEWFHLNNVPLIVDGVDVRDKAKHYTEGNFSVHVLPRRGRGN